MNAMQLTGARPPGGLLARLAVALPLGAAGQDAAAGAGTLPVVRAAGCAPHASDYREDEAKSIPLLAALVWAARLTDQGK